eukprot:1192501-Prorocentrum_minimum.AAC.1
MFSEWTVGGGGSPGRGRAPLPSARGRICTWTVGGKVDDKVFRVDGRGWGLTWARARAASFSVERLNCVCRRRSSTWRIPIGPRSYVSHRPNLCACTPPRRRKTPQHPKQTI